MDNKDKKILYELDKNSRATYSQISKATRISKETVRYRINNLTKEGVIRKFLTVINSSKLGNSFYQITLKLQNIDEKKKRRIIDFLKDSNHVAWIGNLEGNYDIAFILYMKNQLELQKFVKILYEKFSKSIMRKTLSINLNAEFFNRDYLVNKKRTLIKKNSYESYDKFLKLDATDKKICSLLGKDARMSSVEISNKISISADSVSRRIKNLEKEGVIQGYTLVMNQDKMEQSHYKILLHLNNISKEKEDQMISVIRFNNKVIAIVKVLADWDYEIDLEVENINLMKEFTMELTNKFSEIIRDYESIRVINMPKYNFYPD
ncbi:MAG: Lrp/AsnC family transcriptional regulator [Candidatus Pacearchaeota archaeon]